MITIREKLDQLRSHYGSVDKLAHALCYSHRTVYSWFLSRYDPMPPAQDAINKLYDELQRGKTT